MREPAHFWAGSSFGSNPMPLLQLTQSSREICIIFSSGIGPLYASHFHSEGRSFGLCSLYHYCALLSSHVFSQARAPASSSAQPDPRHPRPTPELPKCTCSTHPAAHSQRSRCGRSCCAGGKYRQPPRRMYSGRQHRSTTVRHFSSAKKGTAKSSPWLNGNEFIWEIGK